jgi:uncharacterized repeat protein (TIGR03803 family)
VHRPKLALLILAALAWALAASPVSAQNFTTLASFNGADGAYPVYTTMTLSGSTLYGMTRNGGAYGDGNIFSLPLAGGTPTNLFSFNGTNGELPYGSLTLGGSTLYGMTEYGGANNDGTVFALQLVPEPSSVVLLGLGAIAFAATALRRQLRKRAA